MTVKEAIQERHSVRQYKTEPIEETARVILEKMIAECNEESGLHIQLICDEPGCFDTLLAHYGKFTNVLNYIALVGGKKMENLEEKAGYYGEKLVIAAQQMGLNTCWVAGTFGRSKCKAQVASDEKLVCVISIGYGETQGTRHKSKPVGKLCAIPEDDMPVWLRNGVTAAMLAPTAINQQKFLITLEDGEPVITAGKGAMAKIDLGIVKYNFEAACGHKCR